MRTYVPNRRTPSSLRILIGIDGYQIGPGMAHCTQQSRSYPQQDSQGLPVPVSRRALGTQRRRSRSGWQKAAGWPQVSPRLVLGPNPLGPVELQSCRRPCAWLADADLGHAARRAWTLRAASPHRYGLDDVGLFHDLDHLATDEDLSLAVAGGDTEIGLPCLSGVR